MSGDDLPINIPVVSVAEYFNCPVCMCQMKETLTTSCGHRYCGACIKECVNRLHKCPCCNQPLTDKQLFKDPLYDDMIKVFNEEKAKAEKTYFDKLIDGATAEPAPGPSAAGGSHHRHITGTIPKDIFSPVEMVLKDHLKKSLASHEKCCQQLRHDCERRQRQIEAELRQMREDLYSEGLTREELEQQMADLQQSCDRQKEEVTNEMSECIQLIAAAYDKYLTEHIPDLAVLPVKVSISLLSKGVTIPDIQLKPQDSLLDVEEIIRKKMEDRGDKIINISPDVKMLCFGPFAKKSLYEMQQMASDVADRGRDSAGVTLLAAGCRPVIQHAIKPGSDIAVYGKIVCESDLPKQCFATTFRKDEALKVDYFTCKDCNFNWVCRPCMEVCHKEHSVVPHIMGHQPTWACCYCPKKKKCTMKDRNMDM